MMQRIIKAGTKKAEQMLNGARHVEGRNLYEVYGSFSSAKAKAFEDCRRWCYETNGENFRITSHNSFSYSVAWEMDYVDPETGEVSRATRIETANNSYIVLHEKEVV